MTVGLIDPHKSVAQLVLEHAESARVFHSHQIDFCCRGGTSLSAAAQERGVSLDDLLRDLQEAITDRGPKQAQSPAELATPDLIQHIVDKHHTYTRKAVPFIESLARKVAGVHQDRNPKLNELLALVIELGANLLLHLEQEEQVLFPLLTSNPVDSTRLATELSSMVDEHFIVGRLLEKMRSAADDYVAPSWGCGSYQALMTALADLEQDIHIHVHLENFVLEPRFKAAEGDQDFAI